MTPRVRPVRAADHSERLGSRRLNVAKLVRVQPSDGTLMSHDQPFQHAPSAAQAGNRPLPARPAGESDPQLGFQRIRDPGTPAGSARQVNKIIGSRRRFRQSGPASAPSRSDPRSPCDCLTDAALGFRRQGQYPSAAGKQCPRASRRDDPRVASAGTASTRSHCPTLTPPLRPKQWHDRPQHE